MICFKCKTHFCYLCSAWLDENNPYQHFNERYKGCYMRLWELEAGDGESGDEGEGDRHADALQLELERAQEEFQGEAGEPARAQAPHVRQAAPVPRAEAGREPPQPRRIDNMAQRVHLRGGLPQAPRPAEDVNAANRDDAGQRRAVGNGHNNRELHEGLRHFLELVANDEEDEWDSDELEDDGNDIEHLLDDGWGR
jgi:E3 ubiquitin-protein ligase RNF14